MRPATYDLDLGPMFVGREGSSAAILCLHSASELIGPNGVVTIMGGTVLAGMALGSRLDDGSVGYRLGGRRVTLTRGVGLESMPFLSALRATVNRAVADHQAMHDSTGLRAVSV